MKLALSTLAAVPLIAFQSDALFQKEIVLRNAIASHVRLSSKPVADPVIDAYVSGVGNALRSQLSAAKTEYKFETMVSKHAEPQVTPGGYVFIPANFVLTAQDESEFVAMLAHSIAHVELRHRIRELDRVQTVNQAGIPLIFMAPVHPDPHQSLLVPVSLQETLRTSEIEADTLAIELTFRAGYDAHALRRYIARTQKSAHATSRMAALDKTLNAMPTRQPQPAGEFERVQEIVRSIVYQPLIDRPPTLRRR